MVIFVFRPSCVNSKLAACRIKERALAPEIIFILGAAAIKLEVFSTFPNASSVWSGISDKRVHVLTFLTLSSDKYHRLPET